MATTKNAQNNNYNQDSWFYRYFIKPFTYIVNLGPFAHAGISVLGVQEIFKTATITAIFAGILALFGVSAAVLIPLSLGVAAIVGLVCLIENWALETQAAKGMLKDYIRVKTNIAAEELQTNSFSYKFKYIASFIVPDLFYLIYYRIKFGKKTKPFAKPKNDYEKWANDINTNETFLSVLFKPVIKIFGPFAAGSEGVMGVLAMLALGYAIFGGLPLLAASIVGAIAGSVIFIIAVTQNYALDVNRATATLKGGFSRLIAGFKSVFSKYTYNEVVLINKDNRDLYKDKTIYKGKLSEALRKEWKRKHRIYVIDDTPIVVDREFKNNNKDVVLDKRVNWQQPAAKTITDYPLGDNELEYVEFGEHEHENTTIVDNVNFDTHEEAIKHLKSVLEVGKLNEDIKQDINKQIEIRNNIIKFTKALNSATEDTKEQLEHQILTNEKLIKNIKDHSRKPILVIREKRLLERILPAVGIFTIMPVGPIVAAGTAGLGVFLIFSFLMPHISILGYTIAAITGLVAGIQNACLESEEAIEFLGRLGRKIHSFFDNLSGKDKTKEGRGFLGTIGWLLKSIAIALTPDLFIRLALKVYRLFKPAKSETDFFAVEKKGWLRLILGPLVGFFGPLAHGAEAYRAILIGVFVGTGIVTGIMFEPWMIAIAIAGFVVAMVQNRALEVESAYRKLDDADEHLQQWWQGDKKSTTITNAFEATTGHHDDANQKAGNSDGTSQDLKVGSNKNGKHTHSKETALDHLTML